MNPLEQSYFDTNDNFFKHCSKEQLNQMVDIINNNSNVSLRVIDFFVTIYIKNNENFVHVRNDYVNHLKLFKKRYFDIFCRRSNLHKFQFYYDENDATKYIYTTISQLNFFRWLLSNNVLNHINANLVQITHCMQKISK